MTLNQRIQGRINEIRGFILRLLRRKRIIMFHEGRSGSSVLGLMLHDHPSIHWAGELLKRQRVEQFKKRRPPFDYRAEIRRDEQQTFRKCYGFEMKYLHMREIGISKKAFLDTVSGLGYTYFIILTRRNSLRRVVSGQIAKAAGYHRLPTEKSRELVRVTLDTNGLLDNFRQYEEDISEIETLLRGKRHLHLIYEDDLQADPGNGYRKVIAFLGLPPHAVSPRIQKINIYHPREMIVNFDEVAGILKGTEFEWMLEL